MSQARADDRPDDRRVLPGRPPQPGAIRDHQLAWVHAHDEIRRDARGTVLEAVVELACRQGLVVRREQARHCGMSDAELRRLVSRRRWSAPRRGVLSPLAPGVAPARLGPTQSRAPHGLADQVRAAAVAQARPGTIVSHESAAAVYGLPLLAPAGRPTLSVIGADHRVARRDAIVRSVGLRPAEVTSWFGAPVLTLDRTVADLARVGGVAAGLVAADAALHAGLTTIDNLERARCWSAYKPGVRTVDRVLELADGRAESALESLVRLCVIDGGLPAPEPQVWIDTNRGPFRVDLCYRDKRVIIEADGDLKYTDPTRPHALLNEKRRQEALERAGYVVIRVTWWEVWNEPADVVDRVRRALAGLR